MSENWPSVFFHRKLQLMLVVYVDGFKLAGPKKHVKEGWELLRKHIKIEPETDLGLYLGCNQSMRKKTLPNGTKARVVSYDMEKHLEQSFEKYLSIVGPKRKLKVVGTPSLAESSKDTPLAPDVVAGSPVKCEW